MFRTKHRRILLEESIVNKATKKELGIGIFFALLSGFYILGSKNISTFTPFGNRGLDSKSIPAMIGWLSMGLSIIYIVTTLLDSRKARTSDNLAEDSDLTCNSDNAIGAEKPSTTHNTILQALPMKLLLSLLFLVLYFFFYQRAGFVLSSIGYFVAQSLLIKRRRRKALFLVLFGIVVTVLIYVVFTKYLTLFLPKGILG